MARANDTDTTSRRRFLAFAGAASAVTAGSLAVAAAPMHQACTAPQDDRALLKLEEQIFEQYEAAHAYDPELIRLSEIWITEAKRLANEAYAGRSSLTHKEQWDLVRAMPESEEHDRLVDLQNPFFDRMDAYMKQMFAMPARTEEGRRAKVSVLLSCVMDSDWRHVDEETDQPIRQARNLLIEFIGGEPGEMLRGQFA
jgi:hypothetical protein